jgi:transcriptional regulator with XRE-family HTH domain
MESIHEYVLTQLAGAKGRWPTVAKETGMSLRTIEKIARREIRDPGVSSVERLAQYFQEPVLRDVSASK